MRDAAEGSRLQIDRFDNKKYNYTEHKTRLSLYETLLLSKIGIRQIVFFTLLTHKIMHKNRRHSRYKL